MILEEELVVFSFFKAAKKVVHCQLDAGEFFIPIIIPNNDSLIENHSNSQCRFAKTLLRDMVGINVDEMELLIDPSHRLSAISLDECRFVIEKVQVRKSIGLHVPVDPSIG